MGQNGRRAINNVCLVRKFRMGSLLPQMSFRQELLVWTMGNVSTESLRSTLVSSPVWEDQAEPWVKAEFNGK